MIKDYLPVQLFQINHLFDFYVLMMFLVDKLVERKKKEIMFSFCFGDIFSCPFKGCSIKVVIFIDAIK